LPKALFLQPNGLNQILLSAGPVVSDFDQKILAVSVRSILTFSRTSLEGNAFLYLYAISLTLRKGEKTSNKAIGGAPDYECETV
jgi:hypothetical protein